MRLEGSGGTRRDAADLDRIDDHLPRAKLRGCRGSLGVSSYAAGRLLNLRRG